MEGVSVVEDLRLFKTGIERVSGEVIVAVIVVAAAGFVAVLAAVLVIAAEFVAVAVFSALVVANGIG